MSMIEIPENIHKMILEKQLEWYKSSGIKINLSEIAGRSIEVGIKVIENRTFKFGKSKEE